MSWRPTPEPICIEGDEAPIANVIESRERDLGGGFSVQRLLPARERRMVGPFAFFDHFGPIALPPGRGVDVRPHPHINLETVTYLFEGEIVHRDSLGTVQPIRPGDVNWMTAGRGIVHSERTAPEIRASGGRVHGLQLWVALPTADEETAPDFQHHASDTLPTLHQDGVDLRVVAGTAFGMTAPVRTFSPLFYVHAAMLDRGVVVVPDEHAERAAYVAGGAVACDGTCHGTGRMLVFRPGARVVLRADGPARVMLLGGAPLDGGRHIWWNFVSSRKERIEQAKRDWAEGRFARIPDDHADPMPLPD